MPEIGEKSLTVIELFQKWMSTRKPLEIGTQFLIEGQDKSITLIECEGYPKGKFIYDNGEDFDIVMNSEYKFIQIDKKQEKQPTYFDDDIWDAFDTAKNGKKVIKKDEKGRPVFDKYGNPVYEIMTDDNGKEMYDEYGNPIYLKTPLKIEDEKKPIILKTFGSEQTNESFHDVVFYDVTEIIEELLKQAEKKKEKDDPYFNNYKKIITTDYPSEYLINKIMKYLQNNNYPIFTKDRLYFLLQSCSLVPTGKKEIMKVKRKDKELGYLIEENNKFMFVPKNKELTAEYSYEDNQALGFYYTADSYLDVALESIKDYKEKFMTRFQNNPNKNKEDNGYQASSTIKTLLAFSCECYLKSLLINNGMRVSELKSLGHSLVNLFASLNPELLAKVFEFMRKKGYKLYDSIYEPVYEANDLTDKFMLDLARNDDAFEDSRYSAEDEKNTDYSFLYKFALSLRNCSNKEYMTISPFTEFIDKNISKNSK